MTDGLPPAATAAHLTDVLRRAGVLGDATVREVTVESARSTIMSRITRLRLSYDGATDGAPESLFLKTRLTERARNHYAGGRQEVAFYSIVAPQMNAGLVPRCFDAQWDAETDDWHLLLEDLTDTHVPHSTWPLPPNLAQCEQIIGARARFHGAWWGDVRLGASVGTLRDAAALDQLVQDLRGHFRSFADALPPERRSMYERLFDAAPRLFERYRARHSLTLVHGDAHVWNCFLPRDGGGDVRLFDWDGWRVGVAATDYDQRALSEDYQWAVLWQITTPVWQAAFNIPPVVWWNNMERVLLAVDDLGCHELLLA